jgi:23S rRNA (pseudouridine1915-N3)-methyltransferase
VGRRAEGDGGLKLKVVSVGKDRSGLFQPAVDEYAGRLKHYAKVELIELPAGRTKADEAKAILARIAPAEVVVALDEHGKLMTSVELAGFTGDALNRSQDLALVIGGDEGLDPTVLSRARLTLSLSKMTLPHRLARAVLMEQLYRAFTIIRGEPYHRP